MDSSNKVRLQKAIAEAGITSRRKAEALILAGKVKVNEKIIKEMGYKVDPHDKIEVLGREITKPDNYEYYLLNKPRGYVSSASDPKSRPTVIDLVPTKSRIYPVGRLDMDTTGALILSNDGEFTHLLTHPQYELEKTYRVSVSGKMPFKVTRELESGVNINKVQYLPMQVSHVKYLNKQDRTVFTITLKEGKNRQIRTIMDHFNLPVIRLHRFAIGPIELTNLKIGEVRKLKPYEIKKLRQAVIKD